VQYGWRMWFRKLWTFGFNLEKIDWDVYYGKKKIFWLWTCL
jgi:hypothetical protein